MSGWKSLDSLPDMAVVLLAGLDAEGFPFMEVKDVDHEIRNAKFYRQRGYFAWTETPPNADIRDFKTFDPHERSPFVVRETK
jgi:hypothetical protein